MPAPKCECQLWCKWSEARWDKEGIHLVRQVNIGCQGLDGEKGCPHMEVTGVSRSVETMLSVFVGCQG